MLATLRFSDKAYIAAACCMALGLVLAWWSRRGVKRGKPAIPKDIIHRSTLFCFLVFLFFSAPLTFVLPDRGPPWQRKFAKEAEAEGDWKDRVKMLQWELDDVRSELRRAQENVDQMNGVVKAMLVLVLYLVGSKVVDWLALRTDDRNWIHGGIRPPPDKMPPETPEPQG